MREAARRNVNGFNEKETQLPASDQLRSARFGSVRLRSGYLCTVFAVKQLVVGVSVSLIVCVCLQASSMVAVGLALAAAGFAGE